MTLIEKPFDLSTLELDELIGKGGFGKVFKAKVKNSDMIYAAKISFNQNKESDEMINTIREVNIMSKFQHPSILKLIGYSPTDFDTNPSSVIISEYAPNGSLNKMIELERNGRSIKGWDETQKLICIYGIASAMDYLHSNKVIHRDLKPENIMLDQFLYPKIGDFGLAKVIHQSMDSMTFIKSTVCTKGTGYYIAPEIIGLDDIPNESDPENEGSTKEDDENWFETIYSPASDVYAFAFIVFELITCQKPYQNLNIFQIWTKITEGDRPKFKKAVPSSFKKLIEDCWSHNPSNRPSFHQIVENLEKNKKFLTNSIDDDRYLAYVNFIKESKKSFDSKKVVIDPTEFMKKQNIKIEEIKVDDELKKSKKIPKLYSDSDSEPISKVKTTKNVQNKPKPKSTKKSDSDSDSEPISKSKTTKNAQLKPKSTNKSDSDSDSKPILKAKTTKNVQLKPKPKSTKKSDSDSDSDSKPISKSKTTKNVQLKPKPKSTKKSDSDSDSDSEPISKSKTTKSKQTKPKSKQKSDSESDNESISITPKKPQTNSRPNSGIKRRTLSTSLSKLRPKIIVVDSDSDSAPKSRPSTKGNLIKGSSTNDIEKEIKITLYPKNDFKALSESCKDLVKEAETSAKKQFKVAKNLIDGSDDFPENKELGVSYLKKSLSKGYIDPKADSIRLLVEGKEIPQDIKTAKKYLTENMDEDNPNYPVMMGKIMKKESKFSDAKKVLERAASIDNGEAQYELGKMYFKGQGVEVNQEEAMRLFNKSQDNGCSKSSKFLKTHVIVEKKKLKVPTYKRRKTEGKPKTTDSEITTSKRSTSLSKKSVKTDIVSDRRKEVEKIGDVDEKQFKSLSSLFSNNPESAIKESESFLMKPDFSSYTEYLDDVKKTMESKCCIVSWTKGMLSARCLDCQLNDNSCICIPCFLAGKHDQHHSFLLSESGSGNCDCGDPSFWKKSGNCPHHPGQDPDPDLTQMTPLNRKKFITVFKAAFVGGCNSKSDEKGANCFKWIQNFIQFGDGFRRCCAIAITSIDESFFYSKLEEFDDNSIKALIDLLGQLVSDYTFCVKMGCSIIKNYLTLKKKIQKMIFNESYFKKSKPFRPINKLLKFSFHFFNENPIKALINESYDWVSFFIKFFEFVFETVIKVKGDYPRISDGNIINEIWYLQKFVEVLLKDDSQHSKLQQFINRYSQLLAKYEACFSYSYLNEKDEEIENDANEYGFTYINLMTYLYSFNLTFTRIFEASEKNKKFLITETFNNLSEFLQNQKDFNAVSVYSNEKKIPISPILPLHHLFYCLLSSYRNPTEAIAKECDKKCIDIQDFCSLCSIYPLRFISSVLIPRRFSHLDDHVFRIIVISVMRPDDLFNQFFGLYQMLLGMATEKGQLMKNAAETFGLFSKTGIHSFTNITGSILEEILFGIGKAKEIDDTAHFQAAIFLISALTERSIINFDQVMFKRMRVIELMMRSKPTASEIESHVKDKISNPVFGDDLSCYAERVKTSNGSYFKLTNESDFTPFFPLIFNEQRIKLLTKNEDKLASIPEFVEMPSNLTYIECFRTPLFIGLMFYCLRNKDKLADYQVGLSMFVLSMQNGPKFDSNSYRKNKNHITVEGENIGEIIENLSYKLDDDSINFATIKFALGDERPVSILELVESNTTIGYEAIQKADLPIKLKIAEDDEEKIKKQKKVKASKIKEEIMKEYETRRNVFNLGGTAALYNTKKDDDEDENDEDQEEDNLWLTVSMRTSMSSSFAKSKLQCSVCQNSESLSVMCFPCLSIPSIFPSIIDSKLHNLKTPLEDMESVFSLSICTHSVHYKCCTEHNKNDTFKCMIDRGQRNCLLPYFPSKSGRFFEQKLSTEMTQAIKDFMMKAFKIDEDDDQFLVALKSFAGAVLIVEVRHRSRPECLDNASVPFLLRNLLLTLYFYFNRIKPGVTKNFKGIKDPLLKLVISVINSKNPRSEFKNFVNEIGNTLKGDFLLEFLRRAAIIEDFALMERLFKSDEKFIDWDEILSLDSLLDRFDEIESKRAKNDELPLFKTIPLADRFVGLYQKPYNLDIFDNSIAKFVDLLTGKIVFFSEERSKIKTDLPFITDYIKEYYKNGLAMFLGITGTDASALVIVCPEVERFFTRDSFYVDQFGDIDHGLSRGTILSLSQDRLESALDKLLSGDVLLY